MTMIHFLVWPAFLSTSVAAIVIMITYLPCDTILSKSIAYFTNFGTDTVMRFTLCVHMIQDNMPYRHKFYCWAVAETFAKTQQDINFRIYGTKEVMISQDICTWVAPRYGFVGWHSLMLSTFLRVTSLTPEQSNNFAGVSESTLTYMGIHITLTTYEMTIRIIKGDATEPSCTYIRRYLTDYIGMYLNLHFRSVFSPEFSASDV